MFHRQLDVSHRKTQSAQFAMRFGQPGFSRTASSNAVLCQREVPDPPVTEPDAIFAVGRRTQFFGREKMDEGFLKLPLEKSESPLPIASSALPPHTAMTWSSNSSKRRCHGCHGKSDHSILRGRLNQSTAIPAAVSERRISFTMLDVDSRSNRIFAWYDQQGIEAPLPLTLKS